MLVASLVAALSGLLGVVIGSVSSYIIAREQFDQQASTKIREEKATACTTTLTSTWKVHNDLQKVGFYVGIDFSNDKPTLKAYGNSLNEAMKSTLRLGESTPSVLLYESKGVGDVFQQFGQEALEVIRHVPLDAQISGGHISAKNQTNFNSAMKKLRNTYARLVSFCRQEIGTT